MIDKVPTPGSFACYDEQSPFGFRMLQSLLDDAKMGRHVQLDRLHGTMLRTAAAIVALKKVTLVHNQNGICLHVCLGSS